MGARNFIEVSLFLLFMAALVLPAGAQDIAMNILVWVIYAIGIGLAIWVVALFASAFSGVSEAGIDFFVHPSMLAASTFAFASIAAVWFLGWWLLYIALGIVGIAVAALLFYWWRKSRKRNNEEVVVQFTP